MNRRNFLITTATAAVTLPLLGLPKTAEALTGDNGWSGQKLTGFVPEKGISQEPAGTLIIVHAPNWATSVEGLYKAYRKSLGFVDQPTLLGDSPIRYLVSPMGSPHSVRQYCESQEKTVVVIITTPYIKHMWMYMADQIVKIDNDGFHVQKDRYRHFQDRTWVEVYESEMRG